MMRTSHGPRRAFPLVVAVLLAVLAIVPPLPGAGRAAGGPEAGDAAGEILLQAGRGVLRVELAADEAARERGLMFRRELAPDAGMLFVFPAAGVLRFWMRDTYVALDIAFVGPDRRILNILPMVPLDVTRFYVSAGPAQFAVEANQGWFAAHGVRPGDPVRFRLPGEAP